MGLNHTHTRATQYMTPNVCFLVPPPPPPPPPSCFPSTARVTLENGKSVTMSELRKGDKVEAGKKLSFVFISELILKPTHTTAYTSSEGNVA